MGYKGNKKGVGLLEVLLAVAVFAIGVMTVLHFFTSSYLASKHALETNQATMLAEEGLEAVRSIRDDDFENLSELINGGVLVEGGKWVLKNEPEEDIDGKFERRVDITEVDEETWEVAVTVTWDPLRRAADSVSLTEELTIWREPLPVEAALNVSSSDYGEVTDPGEGEFIYDLGEVVDLLANPEEGHEFTGWSGDVEDIDNTDSASTTIEMNDDYSITANFEITEHELILDSTDGGSVMTPGEGTFEYTYGDVVDIEADEDSGYEFTGWTGDTETIANSNNISTTIEMLGDYSVTANFEEITHELDINSTSGGSVTDPGEGVYVYSDEETVDIVAGADSGYVFIGWSGDTGTIDDIESNSAKIEMLDDYSITANFEEEDDNGSCPFIYSFDGEEYHFEHESMAWAVDRSLETTSYGTLRKLREVNGKYYVKITEELPEQSFLNSFRLFTVDYPAERGVIEVFADIKGKSHTIKERISPISFTDSEGNSKLEKINKEGEFVGGDRETLEKGRYVETYEAVFEKPDNLGDTAKLMVSARVKEFLNQAWFWTYNRIRGERNLWWIEKILGTRFFKDKHRDFIGMAELRVELWDGEEWRKQENIKAGMYIVEEFLISLDTSLIKELEGDVRVRFRGIPGFSEIDQVHIDFSENEPVKVKELKPDTALFNGEKDVLPIIEESNNERLKMLKGDRIGLIYSVPSMGEDKERGFMVAVEGYYHMDENTKQNPFTHTEGKGFLEIAMEIIQSLIDAIRSLPGVFHMLWFENFVYNEPLEVKSKKIIVEQVLPWIDQQNR